MIKFLLKKRIIISVVVVLVILGVVYAITSRNQTSITQYQATSVKKGPLVSSVTASGQVSAANNTSINALVSGVVKKLNIKNGDRVVAGQPVAVLDLDQTSSQKYLQQQAAYLNAANSLESAKLTLKTLRSDMLNAEDAFVKGALNKNKDEDNLTYITLNTAKQVAEKKYENQQKVIEQTQLNLASAATNLKNYSPTIYAPVSGVISGLAYQEGSVIPAQAVSSSSQDLSQKIASVTTSGYPIVTVNLTEIGIPKVVIGASAVVTFDAFPDKTFTGKVFSINTTGQVSSGVTSYPTTIKLDTENPEIYANMSAVANIILETKDSVLYVPSSAVVSQSGQTVARTLNNGTLDYVPVETGITSDTSTEIVTGLNEGQEVVTAVVNNSASGSSRSSSVFGIKTGVGGGGSFRRPD